jgi:hypothetical protein
VPANNTQAAVPRDQTLVEHAIASANISASPMAIPDGEAAQLENLMPYAPGNLAIVPGPATINSIQLGGTFLIQRFWAFTFSGTLYFIAQATDGAVFMQPYNGTAWTQLVAPGGTTADGLHMARWQGVDAQGNPDAVLWCDTQKGYGSIVPTTWRVIDATKTGQCLAVYAGRVWIANGATVIYTAPDSYADFLAADYAGSFTVNDPTLNGNIIGLQVAQNWLYLIGAGMMALNNVQVQSVAGSSTLVTTYYLTPVSSAISIVNEQAALTIDNALFIASNGSLWLFSGLNGEVVSAAMGNNFNGDQFLIAANIFGKLCIITSAGYVYLVRERRWFTMIADAQQFTAYTWTNAALSPSGQSTILGLVWTTAISGATAIQQIGADTSGTIRTATLTTKLYDCGNASINKQFKKIGCELWPNDLIAFTLPTGGFGATLQALGFNAVSEAFSMLQWLSKPAAGFAPGDTFLPRSINLIDRYAAIQCVLNLPAGISVGAVMIQFDDLTPWPDAMNGLKKK